MVVPIISKIKIQRGRLNKKLPISYFCKRQRRFGVVKSVIFKKYTRRHGALVSFLRNAQGDMGPIPIIVGTWGRQGHFMLTSPYTGLIRG